MILGIAAAVLSYLAGWPIYGALIRWGVVDRPNARSSHTRPTARGGGLAILVVLVPLAAAASGSKEQLLVAFVLLGAAVMLAAVSFVDDLRSLPASVRFGCHGVAAGAVLFTMSGPGFVFGSALDWTGAAGPWVGLLLSAIWMTGYANAFNFMDGINGIAAGQATITAAGMAFLGGLALGDFGATPVLVSWIIAGAAAGFLPHNFPRARMFMGDVGSVPLGFLLASVALWMATAGGGALIVPLVLLHANFVLDTGITLVRRVLRGEKFHEPHREHFYQRLVRSGKSHTFVTTVELVLQALVVVFLVFFVRCGTPQKWYIGIAVIALWLAFFCYANAAYRRSQQAGV